MSAGGVRRCPIGIGFSGGVGAIAGGATQINIMISQTLSSLEVGASTYLYNADRLYQLPLGLVGVAVGLALLPRLARAVRADDGAGGKNAQDEAVVLSMALTLPAAMALMVMPYLLIAGFFQRGHFTGGGFGRRGQVG